MKKIFALLIIIAILKIATGVDSSAHKNPNIEEFGLSVSNEIAPEYTALDGNLFLAIDLKQGLTLQSGDVVQFDFGGRNKLVSFHINDRNRTIIDNEEAELFVIIHHDLALMLKDHKLKRIRISHNDEDITVDVNQRWAPDQNLINL